MGSDGGRRAMDPETNLRTAFMPQASVADFNCDIRRIFAH